ncbi:MAG: cobalt transporter CbiM [Desulfovibrio sp.]|uniref:cobalt transporter CbiM n=1 Tax=Desulfovibrio sp. 7SRBS1 TaxID=3378064 RepID=UPI003B421AE1
MHISEGVLSGPILLAGGALTVVGTAIGLKKMDYDHVMTVALVAAAFFVASLIHVNAGPASVHLILNGLAGVMLGWAAFPAILTGLLLQAILFQYGGLSALGVNTFDMAGPAVLCYYMFRPLLAKGMGGKSLAAFGCGFCAVLLAALFTAVALTASDEGFLTSAKVLVVAHLPVMVIEGFVTMFAYGFLAKVKPDLLMLKEGGNA